MCGVWLPFSGDREALRRAIENILNQIDPGGRLQIAPDGPRWKGTVPIELSYSHTAGAALLVWSTREPVGVDIEPCERVPRRSIQGLGRRYFSESEAAELDRPGTDPEELRKKFLSLWIRKEAYGKLTRKGLADALPRSLEELELRGEVEFAEIPVVPRGWLAIAAFHAR